MLQPTMVSTKEVETPNTSEPEEKKGENIKEKAIGISIITPGYLTEQDDAKTDGLSNEEYIEKHPTTFESWMKES